MTVAIPEPKVTSMLVPKLIVAAVPTGVSLSLTSTPVPAATIPTSAEPSSAGNAP